MAAALTFATLVPVAWADASSDGTAEPPKPTDAADAKGAAEEHFRRGLSHANTPGGWEAALAEFHESRRLFPTRSATRNAAIASRALGRYADALELYDALLADFAGEMSESERSGYQAERRALLEHFGTVTIRLAESGASVVVDGRERGTSPLAKPLVLEAGTHVVSVTKDGYQTTTQQLYVTGGGQRSLDLVLKPLSGARILAISETAGEALDVVVDAATVGKAPWRGNVSAGLHSVLLRAENRRGTAPITVDLRAQPTLTLTLRAVELDAEARITPVPAFATIYIDEQLAGSGGWSGGLPSGSHRLDVIAPDYLPYRQEIRLAPGKRAVFTPHLARNRSTEPALTGFYLEPNVGLLFGRTLRGGVDDACDCDSRSRPFGWSASLRAGYSLLRHLAPELSVGFMRLTERSTRTVYPGTEPGSYGFVSNDERDSVAASGPFTAVGVAARFFRRFPVTARLSAGAAILNLSFSNAGTFSGYVVDTATRVSDEVSGRLSIPEPSATVFVPFVATELRAGYSFNRRLSVDLGVSLAAFFPPTVTRAQRAGLLSGPDRLRAGVLTLPDEVAMRAFMLLSPLVGARVEF